jgi:ubiquinone/menaquinone biosynthesis C-methylase UbiE
MPYLMQAENQIVLDVGAGTGNFAPLLPRSATYLWLDNDMQKLRGFKKKWSSGLATLGDATRIGLKDKSVDYALCIALAHHLSDIELPLLFSELARVVRRKLIFLDPVEYKRSWISNLAWRYDQGSYPRSVQVLRSAMEPWFEVEKIENYAIYHHYLLCISTPRRSM